MKQFIQEIPEDKLLKKYPSKSKIDGWYFRLDEISAGVYEIEAMNKWGCVVSLQGTDPDKLIVICENNTEKINNKSNIK